MRFAALLVAVFILAPSALGRDLSTAPADGQWAVGYGKFTLEAGPDEYTDAGDDRRKLLIETWFPAKAPGAEIKPWASEAMGAALSEGFPFPKGFEKQVSAHAWLDAEPADGRFPVVIFSHGLGFPVTLYQSFLEDLASRGYAVFAINHPHGVMLIEYPDGGALDMSARPKFDDETKRQAFLAQDAKTWSGDISAVIGALKARSNPMFRHTDASKVALLGHSLGGTAAGQMSRDKRVSAVVVMEGHVRDPSDENYRGTLAVEAPLLHLIGGYNRPAMETGAYMPGEDAPVFTAVVNGTGHAYFSDLIYFYSAFADADWHARHRYELDSDRVIRIARDYIAAFLDRYLKGEDANVLLQPVGYAARTDGPATAGYPEVDLSIAVK